MALTIGEIMGASYSQVLSDMRVTADQWQEAAFMRYIRNANYRAGRQWEGLEGGWDLSSPVEESFDYNDGDLDYDDGSSEHNEGEG